MAKYEKTTLSNLSGNPTSAQSNINSERTLVQTALENTLSRDGTSPNTMSADLDMNSQNITNAANISADAVTIAGQSISATGWDWEGSWATSTAYIALDTVENNGNSYICILAHTSGDTDDEPGVGATEATYWDLIVQAGSAGAAGLDWQGSWVTSTAYAVNDGVKNSNASFICTTAHTSSASDEPEVGGSWTTYWDYLAEQGGAGAGSGDLLAANNLSDVSSAATSATNLGLGTGNSPQFTAVNVGHATDTTLTRVSAGVVAVEGTNLVKADATALAEQADATWEAGTGTTASIVAPDAIAAAIAALGTGWVLIDTQTISSAVASLDLTHANIANYRYIKLVGEGFSSASAAYFRMKLSTDGGSTWLSTGFSAQAFNDWTREVSAGGGGGGFAPLSVDTLNQAWVCDFIIDFYEFNQSTLCHWEGTATTDQASYFGAIVGRESGTTARDAIQLYYSTGNIDAGTVRIYGRA